MGKRTAEWSQAVCAANGIEIFYTRTGGNKPPLLLLHGLMTNGLCWSGLARALEDEYDVLMPDARGHGRSGVPDFGYGYEDHARDVIALIKDLRLSRPVLLGHSMGGMTAAVVANREPGLLGGLVLADPPFIGPKIQREVRDSDVADKHRRLLGRPVGEVVAEARSRHPDDRSDETLELLARARLQTSMAALDVLTPPYPDHERLMKGIDLPSLLIFGDRGVVSSAVAGELRRLNPKLQVERIPEAGHAVQLDQPERFASAVRSFLKNN